MYNPDSNTLKPITEEDIKNATEPVLRIGQEVKISGLVFTICGIKKKKIILRLQGKEVKCV